MDQNAVSFQDDYVNLYLDNAHKHLITLEVIWRL